MPDHVAPDFSSEAVVLQHLQQPYCASGDDLQSLKAVINIYEESITTLDAKFAKSKTRGSQHTLTMEKRALIGRLDNARSLLSPIRKIPAEVMAEIFYQTCYIPDMAAGEYLVPPDRGVAKSRECTVSDFMPLVLQLVCRLWRNIVIATPQLYTQIFLPQSQIILDPKVIIPTWLRRSQPLPLEVFVEFPRKYFKTTEDLETLCHELRGSLVRVTQLWISNGPELTYLFPPGTSTELPLLRALHFTGYSQDLGRTAFGDIVVKSLADFSTTFDDAWGRFIQFGNALTRFSCPFGQIDSSSILLLFLQHPTLKEFRVVYTEREGQVLDTLPDVIPLPNLTHLILQWDDQTGGLCRILEKLRTPKLTSLTMRPVSAGEEISLVPFISGWIHASQADLQYLSLGGVYYEPPSEELWELLKLVPSLEEIFLSWGCTTEDMATLNRNKNPDICPSLVRMAFQYATVPLDAFMEMLSSRVIGVPPEGSAAWKKLETLTLRDVYEQGSAIPILPSGELAEEIDSAVTKFAKQHTDLKVIINETAPSL